MTNSINSCNKVPPVGVLDKISAVDLEQKRLIGSWNLFLIVIILQFILMLFITNQIVYLIEHINFHCINVFSTEGCWLAII